MYAVIQTGGKQYKVAKNDVFTVEKLAGAAGDTVELDSVLMLGDGDKTTAGTPFVEGATVAAEVVEQTRGEKIIVFKKQRRQNHRRRNGHRQHLTVLRVTDILTDGKKPAKAKAKTATPEKAEGEAAKAPKKVAAKTEKTETKKAAPKKAETDKTEAKKAAPKKAAPKKAAAEKKPAAKKKAAPKKADAGKKTTAKKKE